TLFGRAIGTPENQGHRQDTAMTAHTTPSTVPHVPHHPRPPLSKELMAKFIAIVGEKNAITDPADQEPYLVEQRNLYRGNTPLVLRAGSTEEVSKILKLA